MTEMKKVGQQDGVSLRDGMGLLVNQGLKMSLWRSNALAFTLEGFFQERDLAQWLKDVFSEKAEDIQVICFTM